MRLFEIQSDSKLISSDKLVDGENIIGLVSGEFFKPDGYSRNKRFYPKSLWEKVINDPNVKEKLENRTMFGTIGHDTQIDETTIAEGKISHFLKDLTIKQKSDGSYIGIGEACILNTPAGRVLKTLLAAKCKLYTSSRADGSLENINGVNTVNEDSYIFQSFDFVLDPGFKLSLNNLTESYKGLKDDLVEIGLELKQNINILEDINMLDQKLFENLVQEKTSLETEVKKMAESLKDIQASKLLLESKITLLEDKNKDLEGKAKLVESYTELGTTEEVNKLMTVTESSFTKLKKLETEVRKLREEKEINDKFFTEIGSKEEINKLVEVATKQKKFFEEVGSEEEIEKLYNLAVKDKEFHDEVGSHDEIEKLATELEKEEKLKEESEIEALALDLQLPVEKVKALIGKGVTVEEIKDLFTKNEEEEEKIEAPKGSAAEYRAEEEEEAKKDIIPESRLKRLSRMNSTAKLFEAFNNKK